MRASCRVRSFRLSAPVHPVEEAEESELPDDPETMLASASPEELADGTETGESGMLDSEESPGSNMRIEIQTQDPNVRIIWFAPPAAEGN